MLKEHTKTHWAHLCLLVEEDQHGNHMLNEPEIPHLLTDRQQGLKVMKNGNPEAAIL